MLYISIRLSDYIPSIAKCPYSYTQLQVVLEETAVWQKCKAPIMILDHRHFRWVVLVVKWCVAVGTISDVLWQRQITEIILNRKAVRTKMAHISLLPPNSQSCALFTVKPGSLLANPVVVLQLRESQQFQSVWCGSRQTFNRRVSL